MERIHEANLLITFVRKPNGEGHAVLTVRTDHGDLILDNLQDPMMLDKSRYTFLKTIDPSHEGRWVSVLGRENFQVETLRTGATHSMTPDL